jgi:hypothetical protein
MLTRLLAGAAAHDVANLAQSVLNLRAIASAPGADPASYADLTQEIAADLKRLSVRLEALAHSHNDARPLRLDQVCADALTEAASERDGAVGAALTSPVPRELRVRGTPAALTLTLGALLRHAVAVTPKGGAAVGLAVSAPPSLASIVLTVDARSASGPPELEPIPLERLAPGRASLAVRSNTDLILAALVARSYGGELRVGGVAAEGRGLRFALELPRALE